MKIDKKIRSKPWPEPYHGNELIHYRVTAATPVVDHERQLVVDFSVNRDGKYARKSLSDFRVICSKKESAFAIIFSADARKKVWSLKDCMGDWYTSPHACYPEISERDEAIIARWFRTPGTQNHQIDNLAAWMDKTHAAMVQAAKNRRGELPDEAVNLCQDELPKGLEDWIRREVLPSDRTLLYKKGNVRGTCYLCGREVRARTERFRQGCYVTCPDCGEKVLCVISGGTQYRADYVQNIVAAQKGTDGQTVFFRQWHLKRDPAARYEHMECWLEEFGRYAARGFHAAKWLHEYKENYCMNAWRYRLDGWTRFAGAEVYDGSYAFFPGSVPAAVAGTRLQYADIQGYYEAMNTDHPDSGYGYHNVVRYALDWIRYPVMEFLWKSGYRKLVFQRVAGLSKDNRNAIRWTRKTLKECFRFPLRLLKLKEPEQWTMDDVQRLSDLWTYVGTGRMTEKDAVELMDKDIEYKLIADAAEYAPIRKIVKYLDGQKQACTGRIKQFYRDYLEECQQLRLNLHDRQILFPRDLRAAHERTMAQIEFEKNKADQEAFDAQVAKLEKWAWAQDSLLIRPARKQEELAQEGACLHHCVGGYIQRMASGETAIFFIRLQEKPDTPFFTLELQNKRVVQCRTDHNDSYVNHPEVKAFVDAWLTQVVTAKRKKAQREKKKTAAA